MKEKSFTFRENFGKALMTMTDKQAGELIKGLCINVFNGKSFESQDSTVQCSFTLIKTVIEQDKQGRTNGRKGGLISAQQNRKMKSSGTDALNEVVIKFVVLAVPDGLIDALTDEKKPQKSEDEPVAKTY